MDIQRLVIAKPSGNLTALVFDAIEPNLMASVAAIIQDEFAAVEQVLFVHKHKKLVHGQMAGGEFCGNAARSLGYVLARGQTSELEFTMSGLESPVRVETCHRRSTLKMKSLVRQEERILDNGVVSIVHMEGISHAVLSQSHPQFEFLKQRAAHPDGGHMVKTVLERLDLTSISACGLMFVENTSGALAMTPHVWVRDTGTLYAETACASGAVATACVLNNVVSLLQPSGEILDVSLKRNGDYVSVDVGGSMAVLWDGPAINLGAGDGAFTKRALPSIKSSYKFG